MFRKAILAASILCATSQFSAAAEDMLWINLKPDLVSNQILEIAKHFDVDIVFRNSDTNHKTNGYVVGRLSVDEALRAVLSDAGLCFHRDEHGSILIRVVTSEEQKEELGHSTNTSDRETGEQAEVSLIEAPLPPLLMDVVTLKGSLLSKVRSLHNKRIQGTITESVFSDELGQIPSNNIGESVNRLPGVSMLVEKGEGRYFQIRGINPTFNNVTLNGSGIGSPEIEGGGRQAPLDMIASGVVDGVVIQKVRLPDMDGQGIGGILDVRTKSPSKRGEGFTGHMSLKYGFEEMTKLKNGFGGHDPFALEATLLGSSVDKRWSWVFATALSKREYVASGIYQDDWIQLANESDIVVGATPELVKNNYYTIGRNRLNLNGTLEFQTSENDKYFLSLFRAQWDEYQHRNRFEKFIGTQPVFINQDSGTFYDISHNLNLRFEEPQKGISVLSAGGEHYVKNVILDYEVFANQNLISEPNVYWKFESDPFDGGETFFIDEDGILHVNPVSSFENQISTDNLNFDNVQRLQNKMLETTLSAKFDVKWFLADNRHIKFGMKYRDTDRKRDLAKSIYLPGSSSLNFASSNDFSFGKFQNCNPSLCASNILMNLEALEEFFYEVSNASFFRLDQEREFIDQYVSDYSIDERIFASYLMGNSSIGSVDLIAGIRHEMTYLETSGYLLTTDAAELARRQDNYQHWLPSLVATWNIQDNLLLRYSLSRAIGRPDYTYIAPRSYFYENEGRNILQIGNPELNARISWNYDVSLEWYPNEMSVFYISLFKKDIDQDIVELTQLVAGPENIQRVLNERELAFVQDAQVQELNEIELRSFINAGYSDLNGVEIGIHTDFEPLLPRFLSGFSLAANATILDGNTFVGGQAFPLLNQVDRTYAISLMYQNRNYDASLSYAYNDSYLTSFDQNNPMNNLSQGEFGRWDAKFSYTIRDDLKVFVEGVNLNNEPTTEFQAGRERWNTEHEYVGRTIYFGVSVGF